MNHVHIDFESRSRCNLKTKGAYLYAKDPSTEIICVAWKMNDEAIQSFIAGDADDNSFKEMLKILQRPDTLIHAHTASFERLIITHVLRIPTRIEQYRCSMLTGFMCGLPGTLEEMGAALKLPIKKDMDGRRLMLRMCAPDKKTGEFRTSPEMRERLAIYCMTDVEVECAISDALPPIPDQELPLVYLTEEMNDRGVKIDVPSAMNAMALMTEYAREVDAKCRRLSGGASGRQVGALLKAIHDTGLDIANLTKKQVLKALNDPKLNDEARALLELRQQSAKSSTAKITKMIALADPNDSRVRGNLVWHGGATGRYTARGLQAQNLPRGTVKGTDTIIDAINLADLDFFKMLYSAPADALSSAIRGLLVSDRGFLCGDFSAIEMRVLAFLTGDTVTLENCRKGVDVYKIMATKIYKVPLAEVTKDQRQLGKQGVLAAGFGIGAKGFKITCEGYEIFIDDATSQLVIDTYREAHPEVVLFWHNLENAAINAVSKNGVFRAGPIAMKRQGRFLLMRLPSGRCLHFLDPHIKEKKTPWGAMKAQVQYTGNFQGKTSVESIYGGAIAGLCTQATARDIMCNSMLNVKAAGFDIVLTVHDEILAEGPPHRLDEFTRTMEKTPAWLGEGFPLKVESWAGTRYKK